MSLMSLINSGIKSMNSSSDDGFKKQKIFKDQYCEKKSYDVTIQEVKHDVRWSRDLFSFKKQNAF